MSTLYAVRGADLKFIVRAETPDAAGDAFWRETERRGKPAVHSWIVEASSLTAEQVAECEHVVEAEEASELGAQWCPEQRCQPDCHIQAGSLCSRCRPSLTDIERARLRAWVRDRMAGYVVGCLDCMEPWVWSADVESDRDEMAGWIADDLGLDGRGDAVESVIASRHGESDPVQALALCESAGWPS